MSNIEYSQEEATVEARTSEPNGKDFNAYQEYRYSCGKCRTIMAIGYSNTGDFLYCANHDCSEYRKRYVKPEPKRITLVPVEGLATVTVG